LSNSRFIPEYESINTVNYSLDDISSFSASRGAHSNHRVKDLRLYNHGLSELVTLFNNPVLSYENFFCGEIER
jgi:hypothetical protein